MPNRLAAETSPYLRQHADNPVDWYPWGEEAFEAARQRDVPILLSVGYSACHWCHVMAHESFEDDGIAAVMNSLFVNVKVDREERPDVDAIYMQAVQALAGRGGWPMTVFLAPDGRPFYGGTYFPATDHQGSPGFVRVMESIADVWDNKRSEVNEQADKLREMIEHNIAATHNSGNSNASLDVAVLDEACLALRAQFDVVNGGFGRAPKFPPAMAIDFLLRSHVQRRVPESLEMVTTTLDAMAAGGIYDHVGGGFARYSTDGVWLVPHFEKMLYDQALLVGAYLNAYLVTNTPRYKQIVEETIEYVLRDLRHSDGGFYSAEDADSEGIEGKFYLWSLKEVRDICGESAQEVIRYFGITAPGNFRDPHTGYSGNILNVADRKEAPPEAVRDALPLLGAYRATRVRPGLDDKVLLAWNAMFTSSLASAAAAFDRRDWMEAARANARFCCSALRREDGRFLRSWQSEGGARHLAYAEDYAALLECLITLVEVDDVSWLATAYEIADGLTDLFHDSQGVGFFTTGSDAEALIVRPQDFFDNAMPSENSLAANGLLRLAAISGNAAYRETAEAVLRLLSPLVSQHANGFGYLLRAYQRAVAPSVEIALIGGSQELRAEVFSRLLPSAVIVSAQPGSDEDLTPLLAGRGLVNGEPAAYVCENHACKMPVTTATELRAALDAAARN